LMARCGPFEPRPLLAVAVSGGADSMALVLLAHDWARARKGRIVALTVDHGLRPAARAEARQVARWMKARGIAHRVLTWRGAKPKTGIQAAAREARYKLLIDWCRAEGALHLLLAHTRDDQAETVLLRLAAGSGPHGLAAMPLVHETAAARIVRPLLEVPRAQLKASLRARDQGWIEDPSNRDERYARVRVRRLLEESGDGGGRAHAAIARAAGELGRFRATQERKIAALLARSIELFPAGYARLDPAALSSAPAEIGWRALSALLATVGGLDYPPRGEAVRDLHAALSAGRLGRGRTLARCRLLPDGERWLVVREARDIETRAARRGAYVAGWDGRFDVTPSHSGRVEVAGLGTAGWAEIVAREPGLRATAIPYAARPSLPALRDGARRRDGILEVPALGFRRGPGRKKAAIAALRPRRPLAAAIFAAPLSA
jgi:tRNA(Ile)-lysidine synthase